MPRAELNIVARMTDLATSQLMRLRGEVWMLSRVANNSTGIINRYNAAMAGLMAGGMLMAGARGIFAMAEGAAEFNLQMVEMLNNTTMATTELDGVSKEVLRISAVYGVATDKLAKGFAHAYNLTADITKSSAILDIAAKSAVANMAEVEDTANILANTMHSYGLDQIEAANAMELWAKTNKVASDTMGLMDRAAAMGNMTIQEFNASAGKEIGLAGALGVELLDVVSAYTALTKRGFNAAQASTQVRNMLTRLANPTQAATKQIKALSQASGVDLVKALQAEYLATHGLSNSAGTGVLQVLDKAYERLGYSEAKRIQTTYKLLNAQRGGIGLGILLTSGMKDYEEAQRKLGDTLYTGASAQTQFNSVAELLGYQMKVFQARVNAVSVAIGEGMQGALSSVLQVINAVLLKVYDFADAHSNLIGPILLVVGVITGLLGVMMTLGAAVILIAPIFKAGAAAIKFMRGESREAEGDFARQMSIMRGMETATRRLAVTSELQAAATEAQRKVSAATAASNKALAVTIAGISATYQSLAKTMSASIGTIQLRTKAVKGLTQAEIDEAAAAKIAMSQKSAEAQANRLMLTAMSEQGVARKAEVAQLRLVAEGNAKGATAMKLYALAAKGGALAAANKAKADKLTARIMEIVSLATNELDLKTKSLAASEKIAEAAALNQAAANKFLEASTNRLLTVEQRATLVRQANADLDKARLALNEGLTRTQAAEAQAASNAGKAYARLSGAKKVTLEISQAYSRSISALTSLQSNLLRTTGLQSTQTRILAGTTGLLESVYRKVVAASGQFIVSLNGVRVAAIGVSQGVMRAYQRLVVTVNVLKSVFGTLIGVLRTAGLAMSTMIRSTLAVVTAFQRIAAATISFGRLLVTTTRAIWNFSAAAASAVASTLRLGAAQRNAAAAAQAQALALGETNLALAGTGKASRGIMGVLGGIAGKLFGIGLTAMIVYDMWESNFLGLKDLTTRIFGGIVEDIETATVAAENLQGKLGSGTGNVGLTKVSQEIQKDGSVIKTTIKDIGDAYEVTTETFAKNGKRISKTVKKTSKDTTNALGTVNDTLKTVKGLIGEVFGFLGNRLEEFGQTLGRVRKWFAGLFEGGTWQTIARFTDTLYNAFGPETAKLFFTTAQKIDKALGGLFKTLGVEGSKFSTMLLRIGDVFSSIGAGNWTNALAGIRNILVDVFGPKAGQMFEDFQGAVSKSIGFVTKTIEGFSKALNKLIDTGDLDQFFQDVMPTQAEWRQIWRAVARAAGKALNFAMDIGSDILKWAKGVVSDIWNKLTGQVKKSKAKFSGILGTVSEFLFGKYVTDEQGVTYWAQGILADAYDELKSEWDTNIGPRVKGILDNASEFLFGQYVTDEQGVTYWADGILGQIKTTLVAQWENNWGPKLKNILDTVWAFLFGKELVDDQGRPAGWSEGIFKKVYDKLVAAWTDKKKDIEKIVSNIWTFLFGGIVPNDNGDGWTYSVGIVQKFGELLQKAFDTTIKPIAIDIGKFFGGYDYQEEVGQGVFKTSKASGLIEKFLAWLNQAMLDLATSLNNNKELQAGAENVGKTLGRLTGDAIDSVLGTNGSGQSGIIELGKSIGNAFVLPFFGGFLQGIIENPPPVALAKAIWGMLKDLLAQGMLASDAGKSGMFGPLWERMATDLVGPERVAQLKKEIQDSRISEIGDAAVDEITGNWYAGKAAIFMVSQQILTEAAQKGVTVVTGEFPKIGQAMNVGIEDGILESTPSLQEKAANAIALAKATADTAADSWDSVGTTAATSFANGMGSNQSIVSNKARAMVDAAGHAAYVEAGKDGAAAGYNFSQSFANAIYKYNYLSLRAAGWARGTARALAYLGNNAQGTDYWQGGLTWVGERGPELVSLPTGSAVYSTTQSEARSRDAGETVNNYYNLTQNIQGQTPSPIQGFQALKAWATVGV